MSKPSINAIINYHCSPPKHQPIVLPVSSGRITESYSSKNSKASVRKVEFAWWQTTHLPTQPSIKLFLAKKQMYCHIAFAWFGPAWYLVLLKLITSFTGSYCESF